MFVVCFAFRGNLGGGKRALGGVAALSVGRVRVGWWYCCELFTVCNKEKV